MQGLIDPKAMARLALGEALTNLVFVRVTALRDIKASGEIPATRSSRGDGGCAAELRARLLRRATVNLCTHLHTNTG